jgi:hypothetical protein
MGETLTINMAEGIISAIGGNEYLGKYDRNTIVCAANGKGFKSIVNQFVKLGFLSIQLNFFIDGDVDKFSQGKTWAVNRLTGDANISDFVTDEERTAQNEKLKQMKPEDRERVLAKGNETRAAIVRFEKYMEQVNPNNKRSVQAADKAYSNLQTQMNDSDLNYSPTTKKELEGRMNIVTAKYEKMKGKDPQPAPSSQSEDVKKVESIEKNQAAQKASLGTGAGAAAANLFNTNNVINNSKTINTVSPVTSTNAPGVFGATGVN